MWGDVVDSLGNCEIQKQPFADILQIGVLTKFIGKLQCWILFFNKVAGRKPETILKKRLQHKYFPLNFAKILRIPFFHRTPRVTASWYLHFYQTLTSNPRENGNKWMTQICYGFNFDWLSCWVNQLILYAWNYNTYRNNM